ncbi:unnamed protein product [Dracunculus medinensis]|uniref:Cysteine--tRNA ligase, cytoplasmic n=1 Tax=Dracunculus medinensis TaxID=318479 RepID=A0A158Q405_DRAME|nr:unnamed protein product [Dracunculus medinensis]
MKSCFLICTFVTVNSANLNVLTTFISAINSKLSVDSMIANNYDKRAKHSWNQPEPDSNVPKLHLYNSFTRKKNLFVPINAKRVKWYICGPTVYDSAHMGHARAYLSFDILRRVMKDYFGYDIQFVMNITDIDDKIIKRARQNHLFENFISQENNMDVSKFIESILSALSAFKTKMAEESDPDKLKMLNDMVCMVSFSFFENIDEKITEARKQLKIVSKDILADWLDSKYGDSITDFAIFDKLAKKYEDEFMNDMALLNVQPPDVLTRVSEYIPEIIKYVERIINNGYGYLTSDGSVYFDTVAFQSKENHSYAKLVPEAFGEGEQFLKNMRESEGELSMGNLQDKRSPTDFALWKASKSGEPFWESPWGKGRPGWHIECSVMSCSICGPELDIHAGGFDLKFPHHDNEIAQVEAFHDYDKWVNYFLHCGTLRIAGMKMSKSLKNFITIREALKTYTARQLRILFLMHNWNDVLDYSTSTMEGALHFEKTTNEFFLLVKDYLLRYYRPNNHEGYQKYGERELRLMEEFFKIKSAVNTALCDSIDTRTVIEKIRELIAIGNAYINEMEKEKFIPNCLLLRNIANYITWLLKVFGAIPPNVDIGFPIETSSGTASKTTEALLMPYLIVLADFRQKVRNIARDHKINDILEECDRLRDEILPELGVRLEDRTSKTCVKLVDKETFLREQQQRKAVEEAKKMEKQRKQREKDAKEASKRIPPWEMFKQSEEKGKYSKFDDKGIPTHLINGEEISKRQRKKLEKLYETQAKNYAEVQLL